MLYGDDTFNALTIILLSTTIEVRGFGVIMSPVGFTYSLPDVVPIFAEHPVDPSLQW